MSSEGSASENGQADDQFAELSALLLGPERGQITDLKHRVENPVTRAEDVAQVLAEAVKLRSAGDNKLRRALQPTIEDAIGIAVKKNPRVLADALFPIFGKAIRKAIGSELEGMMQSLSQVLEQSLSLSSLKWRIEALRTRKSYAEIVLLRSMLYRVEQVFLIHRRTGLLLLHAESGASSLKDPEMISGMLTAIQDFVRDAIGGAEDGNLETVRMGEFTVVLAYGSQAILAGFVRGVVPRKLDMLFQDELDSIHEEQSVALPAFTGDTSKFESSVPHLEKCLVGQGDPKAKAAGTSLGVRLLFYSIPLLLILVPLVWWILSARAAERWRNVVERIGSQPGIVVTASGERGGNYFISGLRDPLAVDPSALATEAGLGAERIAFRWVPYHSLEPRFAAEREYSTLKRELEKAAVRFGLGAAKIPPEQQQALNEIAARTSTLLAAAAAAGRDVKIEVLGGTDPRGKAELNTTLARDRAEHVRAALAALGVPADRLAARGLSTSCNLSTERDEACRTAAFHVLEVGAKP